MSRFPDPRTAPADEPLAWGGDLEPVTLLEAYARGIFPWPAGDGTLFWWSPDPRAVIPLDGLHVSRSLRRTLRQGRFRTSVDAAFSAVVAACAERPGQGTWITPAMVAAYTRLHELGHAHSVEAWDASGALVGGVYGVTLGAAFMGESMFHRATDASKVALVRLVEHLRERGFGLFDAQLPTPHLARMGAVALERSTFLDRLAVAVRRPATFTPAGRPGA
ncbi:MAG TPA: leucyl/phenylalanyl-tRNA--protein transferase [Egibacteraceae bacterium]|nr:leucyl/phenylalanyl-tRNA--protein transferase [Egibacteraceae bacterium]